MAEDSVGSVSFDITANTNGIDTAVTSTGKQIESKLSQEFAEAGKKCQQSCDRIKESVKKADAEISQSFGEAQKKLEAAFENTNINAKAAETSEKIKESVQKAEEEIVQGVSDTQKQIDAILNNADTSAKAKASKIAGIYRKEGLSASEAMKKAWSNVERTGTKSIDSVKGTSERAAKSIAKDTKNVQTGVSRIGEQVEETESSVDGLSNSFSGLSSVAKKIAAALASAFAVKKLADFASECIELGSDLAEVQNVVDVTFTSMSNKINTFAKDAAASFGLSETMAKRYTGTFGAMAKAFGFSEQAAYEMSTTLTGLAGDVASFYNITQDEAYTKLKSVFTGETESLKDLGVVMTQTALDAFALEEGFGKTTAQMTEMEKVALRYKFVQKQLNTAAGDFSRTSDGWANQVRILTLRFDSLKASLGQGFINLLTPLLKLVNTLLEKLSVLADGFKTLTEVLTGTDSSALAQTSAAAELAASSVGSVGTAAEEAQKKLSTLGIDELNIIGSTSEEASDSLSGIDTGLVTTPDAGITDSELEDSPMLRWMEKLQEKLEPTKKALEGLYNEALKPLMEFGADSLQSFYNNFLVPVGDWALGEGIPKLLDALKNLVKNVDWDKLSEAADKLFDAFGKFAVGFGKGFLGFIEKASEFIGNGLSDFINGVANAVSWLCDNIDPDLLEGIGKAAGVMAGAFAGVEIVTGLAGWITEIGDALAAIATDPVSLAVTAIGALGTALIALNDYADAQFMKEYKEGIEEAVQAAEDAINRYDAAMSQLNGDYEEISGILDDYYRLSQMDYDLLSDEDKAKLKEYYDIVSEYCPQIRDSVNLITGAYQGTREELEKLIENQYKMYQVEAMRNALIDLMEQLANQDLRFFESKQGFETEKQKLIDGLTESSKAAEKFADEIEALKNLSFEDVIENPDSLKDAMGDLLGDTNWKRIYNLLPFSYTYSDIENVYKAMQTYTEYTANKVIPEQERLNEKITFVNDNLTTLQTELSGAGAEMDEFAGETSEAGKEVNEAGVTASEGFDELNESAAKAEEGASKSLDGIANKADKKGSSFQNSIGGMAKKFEALYATAKEKAKATQEKLDELAAASGDSKTIFAGALGEMVGAFGGLETAAQNKTKAVSSAVSTMAADVATSISDALSSVKELIDIGVDAGSVGIGAVNAANASTKNNGIINSGSSAVQSLGSDIQKGMDSGKTKTSHAGGLRTVQLSSLEKNLPHLATGGYIRANTPRLALIGDNKTQGEIVSPEDKLMEMAQAAAAAAVKETQSRSAGDDRIVNLLRQLIEVTSAGQNLTLDGKVLGKAVRKANREYYQTTGRSMFDM